MEQEKCELVEKVESLNVQEEKTSSKEDVSSNEAIDSKQKRKLDKIVESVLKKTANSQALNSVEDKFYALVQKFVELQEQNKKLQLSSKENEKTIGLLGKQRDQAQSDYSKMLLAKDKLENLCRELQRHNKLIKDENLHRIKEEEEKRKEISNRFQVAIDDINQQMSTNTERNGTLIQENTQLTNKLKTLLEQYEKREEHIEKILKHKDLEVELANAKLQQSELKLAELEERNKAEKKIFESHTNELIKKCEFHQEAEKQLRAQLATYTEKYDEFQNTLKKSNQVFESFKSEMDKMTKKMKKLEQDTSAWKSKWEETNNRLQASIKLKDELEDKCKKFQAKSEAMEKLSRSLQNERNALKEELNKAGGSVAGQETSETTSQEPKKEEAAENPTSEAKETVVSEQSKQQPAEVSETKN